MGGFFAPDPPPAPPPPQPAAATADPEAEAAKSRQETVERNRRGLFGTVATSETGVLQPRDHRGKSLLGE